MYHPHRSLVPRADGPHLALHRSNSNPECFGTATRTVLGGFGVEVAP